MLTNLLAIFIVILLSSPKVAYARSDTREVSKTPAPTGEQASKEPTDGRFRESDENREKVKTGDANESSSDGRARRAAAGVSAPFPSESRGRNACTDRQA